MDSAGHRYAKELLRSLLPPLQPPVLLLTISKAAGANRVDMGRLPTPPPKILANVLSAVLPPARVEENRLPPLPGLTTFPLPPMLPSISSPVRP